MMEFKMLARENEADGLLLRRVKEEILYSGIMLPENERLKVESETMNQYILAILVAKETADEFVQDEIDQWVEKGRNAEIVEKVSEWVKEKAGVD